MTGLLNHQECFHEGPLSFLNVLSDGMQVRRVLCDERKEAGSVFAFAFSEELLPPAPETV